VPQEAAQDLRIVGGDAVIPDFALFFKPFEDFATFRDRAALLETPRVSAPPDCAWFDVKSPQLRRGGDPGALFFPGCVEGCFVRELPVC